MTLLVAGVLLFAVAHALPAGAAGWRAWMLERMGENPYKGLVALLILGAIVMMVFGWKAAEGVAVYEAPAWGWLLTLVLMLGACLLFFAPYMPGNVRRVVRHPQLLAVALFGVGHLAAAGDSRSLVLFGGLALWAVVETLLLNRRDGAWRKPGGVPRKADLQLGLAGLVLFLVLAATHEWLYGVTPLPS